VFLFFVDPHMAAQKSSNWYAPAIVGEFGLLIVVSISILGGFLLPPLARFKSGELTGIFYSALASGALGAVLLFLAKLPLYRKGQFLAFGPGALTGHYRKLYRLAYVFLAISVLLLGAIWLRLR
jgi:hypothetical protein